MRLVQFWLVLFLLIFPTTAAYTDISSTVLASDFIGQQSVMKWDLSDSDLQSMPPLPAGSSLVSGAHTNSLLARGPAYLESQDTLDNSDIVHQVNSRNVQSQGTSILQEGWLLEGEGSPGTPNLCSPDTLDLNATPYNERAYTVANVIASNMSYQSGGQIDAGAVEIPDSLNVEIAATGTGYTEMWSRAVSQAGFSNVSAMNYENEIDNRIVAGGKFKVQHSMNWSSYAKVFDAPVVEESAVDQALDGTIRTTAVKPIEQVATKTTGNSWYHYTR